MTNQPLNPVLKNILPGAPKIEQPRKKRRSPETLTRLSMPESFALIEWLKGYKMQPGDSLQTLALAAASALGNPKIGKNHVQQRCEEFNISLPRRVNNSPVLDRLTKVEAALRGLIREHAKALRDLGVEPSPAVLAFLED